MTPRPLPPELVEALGRVRALERVAATAKDKAAARRASGRLLLAAVEAGWRVDELVDAAGIAARTAQQRIQRARAATDAAGLDVPSPPAPRPRRRPAPVSGPPEDREWLTTAEASAVAGVQPITLRTWRWMGLLPNSYRANSRTVLTLKADLERVMRAPRSVRGGVDRAALRAQLAAADAL